MQLSPTQFSWERDYSEFLLFPIFIFNGSSFFFRTVYYDYVPPPYHLRAFLISFLFRNYIYLSLGN